MMIRIMPVVDRAGAGWGGGFRLGTRRRSLADLRPSATASHPRRLIGALLLGLAGLPLLPDRVDAQRVTYAERQGAFEDGTRWMMRVPSNWNGTLIRDLDFASGANNERSLYLLERGYALAGTARLDRRWAGYYDPAREIRDLDTVLDSFVEQFRKPDRVIQFGCSGGGAVGQIIADDPRLAARVDGVIAGGAHGSSIWWMNTKLDRWFVLKALLAPDLKIVDFPPSSYGRPEYPELIVAWRQVIHAAQQTAEGRARIALSIAIGQARDWADEREPPADRNDLAALQRAMYQATLDDASRHNGVGGASRFMFENPAGLEGPAQMSWNTGVDYREFFENSNEHHKRAVRRLYQEAGLDLQADLERVNAFPRIAADPRALGWWSGAGRVVRGDPHVPFLRIHEVADRVPLSLVAGYMELVRRNGKEDLVRTAFVNAASHCNFTAAEVAAAVETMMRRLNTGRWDNTDPQSLNALASSFDPSSTPRFTTAEPYMPVRYNRLWVPDRPLP